jgi:hypothetical protein
MYSIKKLGLVILSSIIFLVMARNRKLQDDRNEMKKYAFLRISVVLFSFCKKLFYQSTSVKLFERKEKVYRALGNCTTVYMTVKKTVTFLKRISAASHVVQNC